PPGGPGRADPHPGRPPRRLPGIDRSGGRATVGRTGARGDERRPPMDAVICLPLRTPVGKAGGALADVPAHRLGEIVVRELIERSGLDPARVDDVIFGNVYPNMEAPAFGRVVALDAGFPVTVPGSQIDRRCGSGLQAVLDA